MNAEKRRFCVLMALALFVFPLFAVVELNPLFTDGMVLQRGDRTTVWGKATPGERVLVRYGEPSWFFGLGDTTVETVSDADGRWSVRLGSLSACDVGKALHVFGEVN